LQKAREKNAYIILVGKTEGKISWV